MKRILRVLIGLPLCLVPMVLATYIWLFADDNQTWLDSVGKYTWYLASGKWDKLPE